MRMTQKDFKLLVEAANGLNSAFGYLQIDKQVFVFNNYEQYYDLVANIRLNQTITDFSLIDNLCGFRCISPRQIVDAASDATIDFLRGKR